ncbi:malonate transporter subunit MadL, partial [Klebsiella quasipneumoniae subsp. quasipneumoniae]|uniref:malonate transporter subunit MadL n=1 Tax=Klebsiella quasipneumoniae TaxID=1463165 RepID=UPI001E37FCE2
LMMSLWDALRMNMMISYQELVRTFPKPAEQGVGFWNAMYIPIVVAMSANQNVVAALKGGPVALIAGLGAVVIGFLLIKPLSKIGSKSTMARSAD